MRIHIRLLRHRQAMPTPSRRPEVCRLPFLATVLSRIRVVLVVLCGVGPVANAHAQPVVAGGGAHSLILKADGTVSAVGQNLYGNLGNGQWAAETLPVAVSGLSNIVAVAAGSGPGGGHSMALSASGQVYTWGYNSQVDLIRIGGRVS